MRNIGDKNTVGNWYGSDITFYVQNVISGSINVDNTSGKEEYSFAYELDINCVMKSPVYFPQAMCGICIREVYDHLNAAGSGHAMPSD